MWTFVCLITIQLSSLKSSLKNRSHLCFVSSERYLFRSFFSLAPHSLFVWILFGEFRLTELWHQYPCVNRTYRPGAVIILKNTIPVIYQICYWSIFSLFLSFPFICFSLSFRSFQPIAQLVKRMIIITFFSSVAIFSRLILSPEDRKLTKYVFLFGRFVGTPVSFRNSGLLAL